MKEKIATIGGILVIIAMVFASYFYIEKRYCLAVDFQNFAQVTKYEFKSIQIEKVNERIWQLEKRTEQNPHDETAKEDLKKLGETKKQYEKELEELGKMK